MGARETLRPLPGRWAALLSFLNLLRGRHRIPPLWLSGGSTRWHGPPSRQGPLVPPPADAVAAAPFGGSGYKRRVIATFTQAFIPSLQVKRPHAEGDELARSCAESTATAVGNRTAPSRVRWAKRGTAGVLGGCWGAAGELLGGCWGLLGSLLAGSSGDCTGSAGASSPVLHSSRWGCSGSPMAGWPRGRVVPPWGRPGTFGQTFCQTTGTGTVSWLRHGDQPATLEG